jgi:hypothetical protein
MGVMKKSMRNVKNVLELQMKENINDIRVWRGETHIDLKQSHKCWCQHWLQIENGTSTSSKCECHDALMIEHKLKTTLAMYYIWNNVINYYIQNSY